MSRTQPVIELTQRFDQADEKTRQLADVLKATSGKLTPILDIALLHNRAGDVIAAGATVTLEGTYTSLDFLDAHIDTARLIVRGKTAAAGPITLQLYDVTSSIVLATVTVTTVNGTNVGSWTDVSAKSGERELAIRVVGDSANAQTLYDIHAQFLTTRFTA